MAQMTRGFIMKPVVDYCFRELMRNPIVRQGFVAALLKLSPETVGETRIMPTVVSPNCSEDRAQVANVLVTLQDGAQAEVELQMVPFDYWWSNDIYWLCDMCAEQLWISDSYLKKKYVRVSILDFTGFPDDTECYRTISLRDNMTYALFSDLLEIQILELKKLPEESQEKSQEKLSEKSPEEPQVGLQEKAYEKLSEEPELPEKVSGERPEELQVELHENNDVISWMRFFNGKTAEDFERAAERNSYIREAYNTLLEMSADDKMRSEYTARAKMIRELEAAIAYGRMKEN